MLRKSLAYLLVGLCAIATVSAPAHAQDVVPPGPATGVTPPPVAASAPPSSTPADPAAAPETAPPAYDSHPEPPGSKSQAETRAPSPPFPGPGGASSQRLDRDSPGAKSQQPTPIPPTTESYSGQIVAADLIGLLLTTMAMAASDDGLSVLPYLAASPVVHGVHGNPGRAVGGLLLHLTVPIAGLLVGLSIDQANCSRGEYGFCAAAGAGLGFIGGMIAATVIDAALLARNVPIASSPSVSSHGSLTPTLSVARAGGGALAGVAGRF